MKKLLVYILVLVCFQAFSQNKKSIEQKILETKRKIEETNQLLEKTKKNSKETYTKLLLIDKKIELRKELLAQLESEIVAIDDSLLTIRKSVKKLNQEQKQLEDEYAKLIYYAYQNRNSYEQLMFLLSAETFNEAYRRLIYIEQYSKYSKLVKERIVTIKDSLSSLVIIYQERKSKKEIVLSEKQKETQLLNEEKGNYTQTLQKLDKEKSKLEKDLEAQLKQAKKLEEEIKRIIEKEQEELKKKDKEAYLKGLSDDFKSNEGKLPWPASGVVVREYGDYYHEIIKRKFFNDGIDISCKQGEKAKSIFNGVVTKIIIIPGSNAAVLVRHGHYLSVYTNIVNVSVKVGDNVKTNQALGTIYTDTSTGKTQMQLQVWKENERQNPMIWLQKK